MFDVAALAKIGKALGWFLTIGKEETAGMRDAIFDLLQHSSQCIRTIIELEKLLGGMSRAQFTEKTFGEIWLHCKYTYTANDAPEQARTHCSDIRRDLRRINFIAAKTLRTEIGNWKGVDKAFSDLADADATFLNEFADSLRRLDADLDEVNSLLKMKEVDRAWKKYEMVRKALSADVASLNDAIGQIRRADEYIRSVLT